MDKKQNLDPQLKAAYDRVMGTNLGSAPEAPVVGAPTAPVVAAPVHATVSAGPSAQKDAGETKIVAGGSRSGGRVSPVLVAIAILLFFAVYTFVWITVFKIEIPFLPF